MASCGAGSRSQMPAVNHSRQRQYVKCATLARVTRGSAQKEIDEPAGEFLLGAAHPRELAAQLGRHDQILAVLS